MATNTGSTTGALRKEVRITSSLNPESGTNAAIDLLAPKRTIRGTTVTADPKNVGDLVDYLRNASDRIEAQRFANLIPGDEWDRLPGRQGELNQESTSIDDTIFGEPYSSMFPGLITGTMTANAILKGIPGYKVIIRKSGEGTSMSDLTLERVGTTRTYRLPISPDGSDSDYVFDPDSPPVISDDGSEVDSDEYTVNYLFSEITFKASYTIQDIDAITVAAANAFRMERVGRGQTYTLTQSLNPIDETDFDTAQENEGRRRFVAGLKRVSLEVGGFFRPENNFVNDLQEREKVLISINPDGEGDAVARGYFFLMRDGQRGDVGALEEESVMFELNVLEHDDIPNPMEWRFNYQNKTVGTKMGDAASIVSRANQRLLDAWLCGTHLGAQYLPNGRDGSSGVIEYGFTTAAIVTDATLSSGLDNVPEFRASLQLDGHLAIRDQGVIAVDNDNNRIYLYDRNRQPLAARAEIQLNIAVGPMRDVEIAAGESYVDIPTGSRGAVILRSGYTQPAWLDGVDSNADTIT